MCAVSARKRNLEIMLLLLGRAGGARACREWGKGGRMPAIRGCVGHTHTVCVCVCALCVCEACMASCLFLFFARGVLRGGGEWRLSRKKKRNRVAYLCTCGP